MSKTVLPYSGLNSGKKEQVARMFDSIAPRYDFLNHFLSAGIDIHWRNLAVERLRSEQPQKILDIATGTGDLAKSAMKLKPHKIVGIDISKEMLEIGRRKVHKKGMSETIEMVNGDSENLPFEDGSFDAAMVAFGVRNFENLDKGLEEINRVLKTGGKLVVLEFSMPSSGIFKSLYSFYFSNILPSVGKMISKDKAAYTYLPESVKAFPEGETFLNNLGGAGFKSLECKRLTFGISTIYTGIK